MLRKLLPPTGVAADFEDASLRVGTIRLPGVRMVCLFNWTDQRSRTSFRLAAPATLSDYWTGEPLGRRRGTVTMEMPPRSARLLRAV
jgi:alpha-galactosidase